MTQDEITEMQRQCSRRNLSPHARSDFRRLARWWELEAMRDYAGPADEYGMNSSDRSKMYAANMRWLVELMDNGVRVVGVRFESIVAKHAYMSWDDFVRRHAERICGDGYAQKRKAKK